MRLIKTLLSAPALAVLLTSPSFYIQAEEKQGEASSQGWYRVHLAVFAHRGSGGEYDELWRNQLQLRYPSDLIRLKTREQYLSDLCGLTAQASEGQQAGAGGGENRLIDILERVDAGEGYPQEGFIENTTVNELDPACRELRPDLFPADPATQSQKRADAVVESAESLLGEPQADSENNEPFRAPTPYIFAPSITDPEFAEMVKKINGAHRYRLLFKGTWPQRLNNRQQATPLLIQGGDAVGKHFELEGFIKVALERYLHVDTDLWLSQFSEQAPHLLSADSYEQGDFSSTERVNEFPALPTPFPVNDPQSRAKRQEYLGRNDSRNPPTENAGEDPQRPRSNLDLLRAEDSSYYVNRTVVMRQNRRMRSGEVHYLDHPLFGLVIKITPIGTASQPNKTVSTR